MNHKMLGLFVLASGLIVVGTSAGIPLPSAILYGPVYISSQFQHEADDVTITARVDGVANPVGQYRLGDNPAAGDFYVLRIRLESLADGSAQSDQAALVGQTVHVYVKRGAGSDELVTDYVIPAQAQVEYRALGSHVLGDWNSDGLVNGSDVTQFVTCLTGPSIAQSGQCRATFDFDLDSDVDLRDFGFLQIAVAGGK